jgi:hypothetical protein
MAADSHIMETLARIEHKVDLLLILALRNGKAIGLPAVGAEFQCPVCKQEVVYTVAINDGVVLRKCGCKTGKIALDLGAFAPPVSPAKKRVEEDEQRTDQEDRRDPDRGRGGSRRR